MKRNYLFVTAVILGLTAGCNKENNHISGPTYLLDSLVETYIDVSGNATYIRTIPVAADYVKNSMSYPGMSYAESNGNLFLKNYDTDHPADSSDFTYIEGGKFSSLFHEYSIYFNRDIDYLYHQHISYNTDSRPAALVFTSVDLSGGLSGIYRNLEWNAINQFNSKAKKELHFNYSENNLSSFDFHSKDYIYSGIDSTLQQNHFPVGYMNQYPNQRNLIGLDVNDIILSPFLISTYMVNYNPFSGNFFAFSNLTIPLIVNQQATFNTNCNALIEQITNPFSGLNYQINYEFDADYNNRIKSMTIISGLAGEQKYLFYYSN